jgi:hypothetical protein
MGRKAKALLSMSENSLKDSLGAFDREVSRQNAEIWEVVRTLVLGSADHNRVLELFYWSQEAGLLETVRALLALPRDAQAALRSFLLRADSRTVSVESDSAGRLVLNSKHTGGTAA